MNKEFKRKELRALLEQDDWPQVFLFKFIVANKEEKIKEVKSLQSDEADITIKTSKNGKFASVSVKELMMSPDSVMDRYEAVGKLKGVISL